MEDESKLLIRRCDPDRYFLPPERHYEGDAGYDLPASTRIVVYPKTFAQIPTNIQMALPPGVWAMIVGRSSTFHKRNLLCNTGIIDNGWTGELFGVVYNPTERKVVINRGDRVVQLILFNLVTPPALIVDELPERDRGEQGFGSTGGI